MQVRGLQYQQLVEALVDAFPNAQVLALMLQFRLEKHLPLLAALPNPIDQIVFDVIGNANAQGWTGELIAAARESRPGNPKLLKLAQDFGLTAVSAELERQIRDDLSFLNIVRWRERLGEVEGQVCRVETPAAMGTGFLLGPNVAITNYHVMKEVIEQPALAAQVVLRFDYKELSDGVTVNPGTECRLAKNWLIDHSTYSTVDLLAEPGAQTPQFTELDYALLRLVDDLGDQPVAGAKAEPGVPKRGWIKPLLSFPFAKGAPIFILQHPRKKPLKLAMDTRSVISLNANNTRVRYVTNTDPGSSGSPVFNESWELVALHHSGDRRIVPVYNQGIPFAAIAALLATRGITL